MSVQKAEAAKRRWAERKHVMLTVRQSEKIRKGKKVAVMVEGRFFVLQICDLPELFDAKGTRLTPAQVRKILKKVR